MTRLPTTPVLACGLALCCSAAMALDDHGDTCATATAIPTDGTGVGVIVDGQTFELTWSTVGGGSGASTAGSFALNGTIGQPEASALGAVTGGAYSLTGGFWSVTLPLCSIFTAADFDQTCMVDDVDVKAFIDCASGAAVPFAPGCQRMDLDHDGDVDLDDFGLLHRCYSGADRPADANGSCALCSGVCTNLAFDPSNCGACGNVCDVTCSGGVCQDGQ